MPASPQNFHVWVSAIKNLMGRNPMRKHNQDVFCPRTKLLVITLINVYHTLITSWAWFAGAEVLARSPTLKGAKLPCVACKNESCQDLCVHVRAHTHTHTHENEPLCSRFHRAISWKQPFKHFWLLHFYVFGTFGAPSRPDVAHGWC